MSEPHISAADIKAAIRATALIAFKNVEQLNDKQLEAVLITLVEAGHNNEAEAAAAVLYYRDEKRKAQMTLKGLLDSDDQEGKV